MNELQIKLDIACQNLDRLIHNEVLVERYLKKLNGYRDEWAKLKRKHTIRSNYNWYKAIC